ncbi:hypothetical protein SISNIDRAFT_482241 [Sistotremastrum niveocremeum HHB9708]|uniref:Uncharacterized protein n=1 Tax=Sistotremastrum niveocremeum HHB9708 TaxID=1314777 RepID=A0A164YX80_9AGAM|nr:hypothetical protein SISNIDRAFT_482241 [Sistotremastrum niveocremeum HHB9708]
MPKTDISDCASVDDVPERLLKIPHCDWIDHPHLTHRIIDYLRANPQANGWAYHLGSSNPHYASHGSLTKLTKYVFARDGLFKEDVQADVEVFRKRMHTYLLRLNRQYQVDVIAIGPLADKKSRVVPTESQTRKLKMIKLKQPWWDRLHKLWYQFYTDSKSKEENARIDGKVVKKRKLDSDLEDFIVSDAESESDSSSSIDSKRRRMILRNASASASKLGKFSPTPSVMVLKTPPRTLRKRPASDSSSSTLLASTQIQVVTPSPTVVSDDSSRSAAIFKDIKEILKMNIRILELEAEKRR